MNTESIADRFADMQDDFDDLSSQVDRHCEIIDGLVRRVFCLESDLKESDRRIETLEENS